MTLTVVIVSYNTADLLRNCLRSVAAHIALPAEVVVVDNASADGSPEMVRREFPQIRLIANDTNRGYAAAINQALSGVQADYVLILNSDIELRAGALEELEAVMRTQPEAGVAGPRLVLPDGRTQETWQQGFSLGEFAAQQLLLDKLLRPLSAARRGASPAVRRGRVPPGPPPVIHAGAPSAVRRGRASAGPSPARADAECPAPPLEVGHLHGAALLVRGEALREVGLMDEAYWMYCEDSDWGLRFRRGGWRLLYVPAATMLHHHGASSKNVRGEMIASYNLAAARYFRLHEGPGQGLTARWLGFTGTSLRLLGALVGTLLTVGLVAGLRRRTGLFLRALLLQLRWRDRWRQPPCVPPAAP